MSMFTLSVGKRDSALWRIVIWLWALTGGSLIAGVVSVIGALWGVVDILWELVTGTNGLSSRSMPARIVNGTLSWYVSLHKYAFTGSGPVNFLPGDF